MKIPAQAFAEAYPKDLPTGSVFKFRESWALLVAYEGKGKRDFLMLQGQQMGQLLEIGPGMSKHLAIAAPFTWCPMVEEGSLPSQDAHRTSALTLADKGLVILGASTEREPGFYAFNLDGSINRDYEAYGNELRFNEWSAYLVHQDQPFEPLAELFSVSAGKKA